jgi:hypothetical protein
VYKLQGKKEEAKAAYIKAYKGFDEGAEYRHMIEVKLSALGVDPEQLKPTATPATTGSAKS